MEPDAEFVVFNLWSVGIALDPDKLRSHLHCFVDDGLGGWLMAFTEELYSTQPIELELICKEPTPSTSDLTLLYGIVKLNISLSSGTKWNQIMHPES